MILIFSSLFQNLHLTKLRRMKRTLSIAELFFIELIVFILVWLLNDWFATLLTLFVITIVFVTLVISLASEGIEKSRVGKRYFYFMFASLAAPIVVGVFFYFLKGGKFNWMHI